MKQAEELFDRIALRAIREGAFPGAVLRIEDRRGLLFERCWGDALHTDSTRIPLGASTLFDLASVSKLFTTTAALRLASVGKLALADSVPCLYRRLFQGQDVGESALALLDRLLDGVRVVDLLSHASGIHYWYPFYTESDKSFESILIEVLEAYPRRAEVIYSDINFMILGRLVAGIAGASLPTAMNDLVFVPIGLKRTSYGKPVGCAAATEFGNRIERAMVANIGRSFDYWRDESIPIWGEPDDGNCYYYFHGAAGHAGVFSDAKDLCRLGKLYLDGGLVEGQQYIDPNIAAEALRERKGGRGLGFQCGENYPHNGAGHSGFTGTYLHVNPQAGLVITLLTNRLHTARPIDITPLRREFSEAALSVYG